ncbi:MAG TPA: 3-isopropylmalate dehydratase small subunit [Marinobacter sp.]|nr:3-isopropylmalate dehydratase small subunit [Marinobacter sp.]
MTPTHAFEGTLIPFDRSNIDTDAILPKQYLKMLDKTGYSPFLFDDERYLDPGDSEVPPATRRKNPEFILNIPPYDQGSILVARKNFGCGSSREHAVWAIRDYGIRAVIAESFGEIFFNNCIRNGIAPILLQEQRINALFELARYTPEARIQVDLARGVLVAEGDEIPLSLPDKLRQTLIEGRDDISDTLAIADTIKAYEAQRRKAEPWIFVG